MASSYSTNLALELIGTGDQAGTWGITTNTNLGTLIEQAISGYVTQAVSTGTDTTITIPNGSTGVARNMYIELTGTGGASTNLIVPANKKLYFVFNNSTGAVTVKVSGQTGVSVPQGKKMILVSNGTDIVNGVNYIADFGTNSFTVTNLVATSATITNLIATTATVTDLRATTSSATVLRSASATLTHLSATSASITNLTLTSLVISNLSIASANVTNLTATTATITDLRAATASATVSRSASATITNLLATSLTVSSGSTLNGGVVINELGANADTRIEGDTDANLFFVDASTDRIGIGTNAPSQILTVTKDQNAATISLVSNPNVGSSASAYAQFASDSVNAALGATSAATTSTSLGGRGSTFFINTGSGDSAGGIALLARNPAGYITMHTGGTTERMRIDSAGNVGIGTTSPNAYLEVFRSSTNSEYFRAGDGQTARSLRFSSFAVSGLNSVGHLINAPGIGGVSGTLAFATLSTERVRITAGGEVYIAGTADRGAYNLQCNGTGVWGAGAYVNGSDERIKEDIAAITSALNVVEKMNPVTYRYKESWSKDQSTQTGFIAQELLTALDGEVYVDGVVQQGGEEEYYSVAYQNIIPILTKAIQELSAKNDALEARLAALEAK